MSVSAAIRPAGPAPMMATVLEVLLFNVVLLGEGCWRIIKRMRAL